MEGVGTQVNAYVEVLLKEPEIFIASPEEGLQVGRDFQRFFHQAEK
jgi:hypothetical protein